MRELLERWNPWWSVDKVPERYVGIKRPKYLDELLTQAGERRVSVVTGPRRSGKTTLLYQTIDALISSGTEPKRILYVQMDHPGLQADIGNVLREFRIHNKLTAQKHIYIFLDEVQYAKNWARWAKAIHDSQEAKLFISGSTTALLEKDAYASLTGRWRKTQVWPLDFPEFMEFKRVQITGADGYLESSYLRDYIRSGGFPEAVLEESNDLRSRMLVELFDDIVLKDAARTRNLRDTFSLRDIAVFMAGAIGTPVSINRMRRTFKLSAEAISNYIDALCSAYLFFPCIFYSKSMNDRIYNPKKYYIIDTGMAAAVLAKENVGAAVENMLALHYHKKKDIWYWKSETELDIVLGKAEAALESKFMNDIGPRDIRGGLSFAKQEKIGKLWVATEDYKGHQNIEGVEVRFVPAARILMGVDGP